MRDTEVNSIGALTGGERTDGWIARLQTRAKRQLGHVVSPLFSNRSPFNELVIVSVVSILILRGSG
jgi:hypothetical protein